MKKILAIVNNYTIWRYTNERYGAYVSLTDHSYIYFDTIKAAKKWAANN